MTMLYIAEKKDVAQAISQALGGSDSPTGVFFEGENFKATWLYGHVLRLSYPEEHNDDYDRWNLDHLPMQWPIKHIADDQHIEHIKKIKVGVEQASVLVNAGDADPEGQRLVDELIEHLGQDPSQALRILVNDNNPAAVKKANAEMVSNEQFKGLSDSALARAVCDQRYGFNLTRLYTLLAQQKGLTGVKSVGRVQTPILGLVVARDKINESHSKQEYFKTRAFLNLDNREIEAVYLPTENDPTDDNNRMNDMGFSDDLAASIVGKPAVISSCETKDKELFAPLPYNLIALQADAAGKFGLSPSKVLEITQNLRDEFRAISYNRSNNRYLSEDRHAEAPELIALLDKYNPDFTKGCDPSLKSKAFNTNKVEAHHAIIPTVSVPALDDLSEEQNQVYGLIVKMYLAQFYPPERYRTTTVIFAIDHHQFKTTGRVDQARGWRALLNDKDSDAVDDTARLDLESLAVGDQGMVLESEATQHFTKPPALYTMKTLLLDLTRVAKYVTDPEIKKLLLDKDADSKDESGGIGTPATRHTHIDTLFNRGFIADVKKKVVSTAIGREFHDLLPDFAVKPDLTALWHEQQKLIESGELDFQDLIDQVDKVIADEVKSTIEKGLDIKTDAPSCPACETGFIVEKRNLKKEVFWGCSTFPECKKTYQDLQGKPDLTGKSNADGPGCEACEDGKMQRKKGANGFFWGCSNYPMCNATLEDKKGKPKKKKPVKLSKIECPDCSEKLIRRKSVKAKAKNSHWWGCSGFPKCKFKANDNDGKPDLKKKKIKKKN